MVSGVIVRSPTGVERFLKGNTGPYEGLVARAQRLCKAIAVLSYCPKILDTYHVQPLKGLYIAYWPYIALWIGFVHAVLWCASRFSGTPSSTHKQTLH